MADTRTIQASGGKRRWLYTIGGLAMLAFGPKRGFISRALSTGLGSAFLYKGMRGGAWLQRLARRDSVQVVVK